MATRSMPPAAHAANLPLSSIGALQTLLAAAPTLSRSALERLTECLIERLDQLDGDDDVEANGDELDSTAAEDDFWPH